MSRLSALLVIAPLMTLVAACSGDDTDSSIPLSPAAEEGRRIANSSGCAGCHQPDGSGGPGPAFVGLYGSEVLLDDGTTVVADEAYLYESITDPSAKRVEGYSIQMPSNQLDDDEVQQVIAWIRELAEVEP